MRRPRLAVSCLRAPLGWLWFDPIEHVLDELSGRGTLGIEPHVSMPVGELSSGEQPLHPGAVGRQRSPSVCWETLDDLLPGYIKPN